MFHKLGSDTRISNDLFIDKAFKEELNSLFGPLLRNFADNSILTDPSHQAMKSVRDRDNIPETRRVAYSVKNSKHKAGWKLRKDTSGIDHRNFEIKLGKAGIVLEWLTFLALDFWCTYNLWSTHS